VKPGAWVSLLVLQETLWVLGRAYELDRKQQVLVLEMLLDHESMVLESPDVVHAALARFRSSSRADFSDCLLLEVSRKAGHLPIGTFDRKLAKLPDTEML
jgi:predicted nucleic-acid-binding protein